jgi:hypothetical protein
MRALTTKMRALAVKMRTFNAKMRTHATKMRALAVKKKVLSCIIIPREVPSQWLFVPAYAQRALNLPLERRGHRVY